MSDKPVGGDVDARCAPPFPPTHLPVECMHAPITCSALQCLRNYSVAPAAQSALNKQIACKVPQNDTDLGRLRRCVHREARIAERRRRVQQQRAEEAGVADASDAGELHI